MIVHMCGLFLAHKMCTAVRSCACTALTYASRMHICERMWTLLVWQRGWCIIPHHMHGTSTHKMHTDMLTCTHGGMQVWRHAYTHVRTRTHKHTQGHTLSLLACLLRWARTCACTCACVCTRTCIGYFACPSTPSHVHVCSWECACVPTDRQTDRQAGRQADRQTHRHTHICAHA